MTHSSFWLETDRLALRRFTPDDLDWLVELRLDPQIMQYVGGPQTREDSAELLRTRMLDYYDAYPGLGNWLTVERETGLEVGMHLLNHIRGESIVQVGFFVKTFAWGRGYATEMAAALLRHGFVTLGLPRIAGMAALDNTRSQRVLARVGLHRNGERSFSHPMYAAVGPMAWFERDAADWLAEREV